MKPIFEKAIDLKRRYAEYGQYHGSKYALYWARRMEDDADQPELDWQDGFHHPVLASAVYEHGPFVVTVALEWDDCPDWSYLGEFGSEWRPGCVDIRIADNGQHYGRFGPDTVDFEYFYPATECRNLDWKEMKKVLSGDSIGCDLHITVSRNGIDLADGWLGGGVLQDDPAEVFDDWYYLTEETLEEAAETLLELCPA